MTREDRRKLRERYRGKGKSPATLKAYKNGWRQFVRWCEEEGIEPLEAEAVDVADYLASMAEFGQPNGKPFSRGTIALRRMSIRHKFRLERKPDPTDDIEVDEIIAGIARTVPQTRGQSKPLRAEDARKIYRLPQDGMNKREARQLRRAKTAISIMRDAMLRVGEAAALDWEHIRFPEPDIAGATDDNEPGSVFIARSKTDKFGAGIWRGISPRTLRALGIWAAYCGFIEGEDELTGPIFGVTGDRLAEGIRVAAERAGLEGITSHSCRIGMTVDLYVTHRMSLEMIREAGRWKSTQMVRHYLKPWLRELDPVTETFTSFDGGPAKGGQDAG